MAIRDSGIKQFTDRMKNNNYIQYIVVIYCLLLTSMTLAKTHTFDVSEPGYWSIQVENDIFASNDDRFYTNGFQVNYIKRKSPPQWLENITGKLPLFIQTENKGGGYSFGQKMFTPEDVYTKTLIKNDRPYAGWLYASASIASLIKNEPLQREINAFEFTVGIVGPSSLAGDTQNEYHKLIGVKKSEGWANQLKDELGVVVTYVRKLEHFNHLNENLEFSWSPHGVLALGNVYTYAGSGMMLRFGKNLKNDIGPPNISPGFPGAAFFSPTKGGHSWYIFGGLEARAMAQNIFLDGNTFKDSHRVDKKPLVLDLQYGVSYQRNNMRLSYSHVLRSKEFYDQKENANFGSLNLSFFLD